MIGIDYLAQHFVFERPRTTGLAHASIQILEWSFNVATIASVGIWLVFDVALGATEVARTFRLELARSPVTPRAR